MEVQCDKIVPRLIVFALAAYCLWPTVSDMMWPQQSKPRKKPPELSAALLSPALSPPPLRNPFVRGNARADAVLPESAIAAGGGETAELAAVAEAQKAARPPALEATCIVENERLAVIGGRLYAPRDHISLPGRLERTYEVVSVEPYKVVLTSGEETLELTYCDAGAKLPAAASESGRKRPAPSKTTPAQRKK